jgi:hypothetical protein
LEVAYGLVNGDKVIVLVRLSENDGKMVRKLILNAQGHYEQHVYDDDGTGAFVKPPRVSMPRQNGQPMTEIPFVLVSTSDKPCPQPSLLQHSVDLNLQHYRVEGYRTSTMSLTSAPIAVITGFVPNKDAQGNDIPMDWDVSAGAVWELNDPNVKVDWFTYDPKGIQLVLDTLKDLKDALSTVGHSILAPEKAAPEAAETQLLRRAAENATLASFTRSVSRKLERALRIFARWADPANAELSYSLNTDFLPATMTPPEMTALMGAWQAGAISWETFFYALRDGEVVSPTMKPEEERARIDAEAIDRPALI